MQFGTFEFGTTEYGAAAQNSNSFVVTGRVDLAVNVPPPQGAQVVGNIALTLGPLVGVTTVQGSFAQSGFIAATFSPVIQDSFTVAGYVSALFIVFQGQQESCVSGPDTPNLGSAKPKNAVF